MTDLDTRIGRDLDRIADAMVPADALAPPDEVVGRLRHGVSTLSLSRPPSPNRRRFTVAALVILVAALATGLVFFEEREQATDVVAGPAAADLTQGWEKISLAFDGARVVAMASNGSEILAVAERHEQVRCPSPYGPEGDADSARGCTAVAALETWTSFDGTAWVQGEELAHGVDTDTTFSSVDASATDIVWNGGQWLITGQQGVRPFVWAQQPDGTWDGLRVHTETTPARIDALFLTDDGAVAVGLAAGIPTVWRSQDPDGLIWRDAQSVAQQALPVTVAPPSPPVTGFGGPAPLPDAPIATVRDVLDDGRGVVVVGSELADPGDELSGVPVAWIESGDGWTELRLSDERGVASSIAIDGTDVLVLGEIDGGQVVWTLPPSEEAAATVVVLGPDAPATGSSLPPRAIAVGPTGAVATGRTPGGFPALYVSPDADTWVEVRLAEGVAISGPTVVAHRDGFLAASGTQAWVWNTASTR